MINVFSARLLPLLLLIIALLILLVCWLGFAFIDEKEERKAERELYTQAQDFQNNLIRTQGDSLGRLVYTLRTTEATKEQTAALVDVQGHFIRKVLLELRGETAGLKNDNKALRNEVRNIKQVTNLKIESNADILTILRDTILEGHILKNIKDSIRIDTQRVYARTFSYAEPGGWFHLAGVVTQDSIAISVKDWKEELVKADFRQPADRPRLLPKFLRRKVTVTKVKSLNPYSSLKDFQQVDIKEKSK